MDIVNNNIDILDNKTKIDMLYSIKNFPIYMGCVDNENYNDDILLNMDFGISPTTGIIQILKHPTDEFLYKYGAHNTSYGNMWNIVYDTITLYIENIFRNKIIQNIYEIGGGNGKLFNKINQRINFKKYIMYEPNYDYLNANDNLTIIKEYFKDQKLYNADVILHSHVLEHVKQIDFLKNISSSMNENTYHIFAIPNMYVQFKNKYTNCLMFEHKNFITEPFIDYLLNENQIEIIKKDYVDTHSIIYITKKNSMLHRYPIPNLYDEYSILLDDFFSYYSKYINKINTMNTKKKMYLFGAHIFSQFLISYGLDTTNIECILDNDPKKQNKRLYGCNLYVRNPIIIKDKDCIIILNVASYKREIKEQLLEINKLVQII